VAADNVGRGVVVLHVGPGCAEHQQHEADRGRDTDAGHLQSDDRPKCSSYLEGADRAVLVGGVTEMRGRGAHGGHRSELGDAKKREHKG